MKPDPIVVRPSPLIGAFGALNDFHNRVRLRRKLMETANEYDGIPGWEREARRRFGPNKLGWKWTCHHCLTTFSVADYILSGAPQDKIGFACLGIFEPSVHCSYNGILPLPGNPVTVLMAGGVKMRMLAFAE